MSTAATPPKPPVTCHVLDTTTGRPASGIECQLTCVSHPTSFAPVTGRTNADGRVTAWDGAPLLTLECNGVYSLRFSTGEYWGANAVKTFFPHVDIVFKVASTDEHYHVPLLLAPWSYSTYRGS